MMTQARFSIGIDLGTTNCALAFVPLHGEARSAIFGVPQWASLSAITESTALPSFLYLPEEAAAAQIQDGEAKSEEWIVGLLARKKAAESPGRVVHSAKSWLCHHTSDRSARFLPWGSDDIARNRKISPVRASALILNHLKRAWNRRFAAAGAGFEFERQEITVTVPASFDAAAQRLTLMAAAEAGFPETVRLLEEPTLVVEPPISASSNSTRKLPALPRASSARQWATTSCWAATMSISRSHTSSNRD